MTSYPTLLSNNAANNSNSGLFCYNSSPKIGSIDTMFVNQSQFSYNSQHGIWCTGSSGSHPHIYRNIGSNTYGGYVQLISNNNNGLRAENYSKPNLGSSSSSKGNNSIYNNSSYEIYNNNSSNLLQARHNWWDSPGGPPSGSFYGIVAFVPPLTYQPGDFSRNASSIALLTVNDSTSTTDLEQGEIYLAEGYFEDAIAIFERVMYLAPNSEQAKSALSGIVLCYRENGWKDLIVPYLDNINNNYHYNDT